MGGVEQLQVGHDRDLPVQHVAGGLEPVVGDGLGDEEDVAQVGGGAGGLHRGHVNLVKLRGGSREVVS